MATIEVSNIRYSLDNRDILKDISFSLSGSESLCVVGPNGAGKSTLLKCLGRIVVPHGGFVTIDGERLDSLPQKKIARLIGYVPQKTELLYPFSVSEFLMMARYPHLGPFSAGSSADFQAIEKALVIADIQQFKDRIITSLSGGEFQRVLIAACLAQEPKILLLDEPATFLDPKHYAQLHSIIESIREKLGLTVITVTHDINMAIQYGKKILALKNGQLIFFGPATNICKADVLSLIYDHNFEFVEHPTRQQILALAN